MKKCMLLLACAVSMPAWAEPTAKLDDRAKFYDFGQMGIDGHTQRPVVLYMDAHRRASFDRLLTLKKSLREPLTASVRDPALR